MCKCLIDDAKTSGSYSSGDPDCFTYLRNVITLCSGTERSFVAWLDSNSNQTRFIHNSKLSARLQWAQQPAIFKISGISLYRTICDWNKSR